MRIDAAQQDAILRKALGQNPESGSADLTSRNAADSTADVKTQQPLPTDAGIQAQNLATLQAALELTNSAEHMKAVLTSIGMPVSAENIEAALAIGEYRLQITAERVMEMLALMKAPGGFSVMEAALIVSDDVHVNEAQIPLISDIIGGRFDLGHELDILIGLASALDESAEPEHTSPESRLDAETAQTAQKAQTAQSPQAANRTHVTQSAQTTEQIAGEALLSAQDGGKSEKVTFVINSAGSNADAAVNTNTSPAANTNTSPAANTNTSPAANTNTSPAANTSASNGENHTAANGTSVGTYPVMPLNAGVDSISEKGSIASASERIGVYGAVIIDSVNGDWHGDGGSSNISDTPQRNSDTVESGRTGDAAADGILEDRDASDEGMAAGTVIDATAGKGGIAVKGDGMKGSNRKHSSKASATSRANTDNAFTLSLDDLRGGNGAQNIGRKYEQLLSRLELLRQATGHVTDGSPEKKEALLRQIDLVENGIRLIDGLNNRHQYMQIPFGNEDRDANVEIFVLKRGKRRKIDPEDATVFVSLMTVNLGKVEALIHLGHNKSISVSIRARDEITLDRFRVGRQKLYNMIADAGYRLAMVTYKVIEEETGASGVIRKINGEFYAENKLFDYRI